MAMRLFRSVDGDCNLCGWIGSALGIATILVALDLPATAAGEAPDYALWFPVGEELVYQIYWGAIPVGESRALTEWVEEDGRRLLRILFRTRTNKVLSAIYPVDDRIESLIEPERFIPLRFDVDMKQGRHRYRETTEFDWERLEARWTSHVSGKTKTFPLEPDTRDIPTLMYWMRQTGMTVGETRTLRVMADEKIYDLELRATGIERIRLDRYGRLSCVQVEPRAEFRGIVVRRGRMWIWVSQDPRHLATQISVEVPVARVHLVLNEVKGPGDDFWILKKK